MKFMKKKTIKAASHRVKGFARHDYSFSVKETKDHNNVWPMGYYRVEINKYWWDYGKF